MGPGIIQVDMKVKRKGLSALVGLEREKQKAGIDIRACQITGEPFPHTLLDGVGGTGKTALARAIAEELGYHFHLVEAAALKNRGIIVDRLQRAQQESAELRLRLLFFVDEVHRLSLINQEVFYYPLNRDNPMITTAEGHIELVPFTMVAATTRRDMLDEASFVGRFPNVWKIQRYHETWIASILSDWFDQYGLGYGINELNSIASRSLGIPRQALKLAYKIRNFVIGSGRRDVGLDDCRRIFYLEGIDSIGLGEQHIAYMQQLLEAKGRPLGEAALAGKLGLHKDVVSGTIEPVLLSLNFIDMTNRGRILLERGYLHLAQEARI